MNRRGKRLTLGVMAVGLTVVIVLGIVHREAIRDHVEAWHFQLTRETETIEPPTGHWGFCGNQSDTSIALVMLAGFSGCPVIFEKSPLEITMDLDKWFKAHASDKLKMLRSLGFRVLEQRFPRRAYVVIQDKGTHPYIQDLEVNNTGVSPRINDVATPKEAPRGAAPAE